MNNDIVQGRRLSNQESLSIMYPDISGYSREEIDEIIDKFNKVPLINPVPVETLKNALGKTKVDYSTFDCNLDDESETNDCWNCSQFVFPIGCMVEEEE